MSLLLIDGSSILNSCFFGTVPPEYFRAKTPEEKRFVLPSIMQTKTGIFTIRKKSRLSKCVEKEGDLWLEE